MALKLSSLLLVLCILTAPLCVTSTAAAVSSNSSSTQLLSLPAAVSSTVLSLPAAASPDPPTSAAATAAASNSSTCTQLSLFAAASAAPHTFAVVSNTLARSSSRQLALAAAAPPFAVDDVDDDASVCVGNSSAHSSYELRLPASASGIPLRFAPICVVSNSSSELSPLPAAASRRNPPSSPASPSSWTFWYYRLMATVIGVLLGSFTFAGVMIGYMLENNERLELHNDPLEGPSFSLLIAFINVGLYICWGFLPSTGAPSIWMDRVVATIVGASLGWITYCIVKFGCYLKFKEMEEMHENEEEDFQAPSLWWLVPFIGVWVAIMWARLP